VELHLDLDPRLPLANQLYRQLREAILTGRLAGGDRLPPSRYLAQRLQVSRKTVSDAYEQLAAEGFLQGRAGSGTFVSPGAQRATARAPMSPTSLLAPSPRWQRLHAEHRPLRQQQCRYNFHGGTTDKRLFPFAEWRGCLQQALRELGRSPGFYDEDAGHPPLRQAIARYLAINRAVSCAWEDLLITQGAQQGLDLLARVILEPGMRVAVEEPGYPPARQAFLAAGAEVVGVPVDEQGLRVDLLPDDVRLVYVTPSHQFPLGMPLSLARRLALLEWAGRRGALIIEDDYDGEYRFEGRPLESLQNLDRHGLVAYLGTFSKTLFPELRLGYLLMPAGLRAALLHAKHLSDRHSCSLQQRALTHFLGSGEFARHTRRMQRLYARRRERLLERLRGDLSPWLEPIVPLAGIHLAVRLRAPLDEGALARELRQREVGLLGLGPFHHAPPARGGLLFGFGCIDDTLLDEGLDQVRASFIHLAPI